MTPEEIDASAGQFLERATGLGMLYRTLVQSACELITLLDPDGRFAFVNDACLEITGYEPRELAGHRFDEILKVEQGLTGERRPSVKELGRGRLRREITAECKDGNALALCLSTSPVVDGDGELQSIVAMFTDVSHQAALRAKLERAANEDELTGLANRRRFLRELHRHREYGKRYGHRGAVLLIDLDEFKSVNDRHGHPVGDELLREVAKRLRQSLRATDLLARLHGDEFAVLLPEADSEAAGHVVTNLHEAVWGRPFEHPRAAIDVSASIGVALLDCTTSIEELFVRADRSLYEAKRRAPSRT